MSLATNFGIAKGSQQEEEREVVDIKLHFFQI